MKLIKNIFLILFILFIVYIVLIFAKPAFADKVAKILGISNFNEKIRIIKWGVDYVSTKVPTKKEIEKAYSWAKNKIEEIKWNIDDIRNTASDIWDKYDQAKDFVNETGDKIEKVKNSLNDLQKVWEDISNVVNKEAIK